MSCLTDSEESTRKEGGDSVVLETSSGSTSIAICSGSVKTSRPMHRTANYYAPVSFQNMSQALTIRDVTSHKEVEARFRKQVTRSSIVRLVKSPPRSPAQQRQDLMTQVTRKRIMLSTTSKNNKSFSNLESPGKNNSMNSDCKRISLASLDSDSLASSFDADLEISVEETLLRLEKMIPDELIPDDNFFLTCIDKVASDFRTGVSYDSELQVIESFVKEAKANYMKGGKRAIISYVLRNPNERRRLSVTDDVFEEYSLREEHVVVRAPIPWHENVVAGKRFCHDSFTQIHKLIEEIRVSWFGKFSYLNILDGIHFPSDVEFFSSRISINCQIIRSALIYEWVSLVANLFIQYKRRQTAVNSSKESKNPQKDNNKKINAVEASKNNDWKRCREVIAVFMSRLLRQFVLSNIERWVNTANNLDGMRVDREVFLASANFSDSSQSSCQLDPHPGQWPLLLLHPIHELLRVTQDIPRIEDHLTILADDEYAEKAKKTITAVYEDDFEVLKFKQDLVQLVSDHDSKKLLEQVNQKVAVLDSFRRTQRHMFELSHLRSEITALERFENSAILDSEINWTAGVMLINYSLLRKKIISEAKAIKEDMISKKVKEIITLARSLCDLLESIKKRIDHVEDTTEDLMTNIKLMNSEKMRVRSIFRDIEYVQDHWTFLVCEGASYLSDTHFELLHTLYNWPDEIRATFEANDHRLGSSKRRKEARLRERIANFEQTLQEILRDLIVFKKKRLSSPLEKVADNVKALQSLETLIEETVTEKQSINFEEGLLGWHSSSKFPLLDKIEQVKFPLDLLWQTTQDFETKQRSWTIQRIHELDIPKIRLSLNRLKKRITEMTEAVEEANNLFGEQEGDEDLKENIQVIQTRVTTFETIQVPLLSVMTLPVLREKHIQQISKILKRKINIHPFTTLTEVSDTNISKKAVGKIEEIGKIATREHALEVFLARMKNEWISDEWPEDALDIAANKFLDDENMETDVKQECVKAFKYMHEQSRSYVTRNAKNLLFPIRVTPPSFIELMLTFKALLKKRNSFILSRSVRFKGGVEKLELAASFVSGMKRKLLEEDQPRLAVTSKETEELMVQIESETIDVEWAKERIASDEGLANRAAALAQQIRDECTKELVEAVPAIESAVKALDTLVAEDIVFLRTMKNPPLGLKMVLESVAILLAFPPERKINDNGFLYDDYWAAALKMLNSSEVKLLEALKEYDKDHVDPEAMKILRENYLCYTDFDPLALKTISQASESLAKWVKAIDIYDRVINVIKPKKMKLMEAEAQLSRLVDSVFIKKNELQAITDKLQSLSDHFASISKEKKDLEESILMAKQKVERAEKLLDGLDIEKERWKSTLVSHKNLEETCIGDTILASAFIVYLSGLNTEQREECLNDWQHFLRVETNIKVTTPYNVLYSVSSQLDIQTWIVAGLPTESFHLENAMILFNSLRFCFLIDPSNIGSDFVKKLYASKGITIVSEHDELSEGFLIQIKKNLTRGRPVLLEEVDVEKVNNSFIQAVLVKDIEDGSGEDVSDLYLILGDEEVKYNPDFNLFLSRRDFLTSMPKTVYSRLCVINWTDDKVDSMQRQQNIEEAMKLKERARKEKQLLELETQLLEALTSRDVSDIFKRFSPSLYCKKSLTLSLSLSLSLFVRRMPWKTRRP